MTRKPRHPAAPPPGEFGYIEWMRPQCAGHRLVTIPSGDDCAGLKIPRGQELLFAVDSVIDGVHFLRRKHGCYAGARKAVLRNLSDIAAMGGWPLAIVCAGGLPRGITAREKAALFAGLNDTCREYNLALVGGDIANAGAGNALWLSVSILGLVPQGRALTRAGARVGDLLFVTGALGGSIRGKHLEFTPRLQEGAWLREKRLATACLDLSDGLARDLTHICELSGVGAAVEMDAVPVAKAVMGGRKNPSAADRRHALCDGEDYELLLSVRSQDAARLLREWPKRFAPLTRIGRITSAREGLRAIDPAGRPVKIAGLGWEHAV